VKRGLEARPVALLLIALVLCGCGTIPIGPVQRPEIYPDRTTHQSALTSFLWAWHTGDVKVLLGVLGAWPLKDLLNRLEASSEEETSEFYRRDADPMSVAEFEWKSERDALAYSRIVLHLGSKRIELDISLLRRPDGWVVTAQRLLR
jgi:hypothetical protein